MFLGKSKISRHRRSDRNRDVETRERAAWERRDEQRTTYSVVVTDGSYYSLFGRSCTLNTAVDDIDANRRHHGCLRLPQVRAFAASREYETETITEVTGSLCPTVLDDVLQFHNEILLIVIRGTQYKYVCTDDDFHFCLFQ